LNAGVLAKQRDRVSKLSGVFQ